MILFTNFGCVVWNRNSVEKLEVGNDSITSFECEIKIMFYGLGLDMIFIRLFEYSSKN